MTGRRSKRTRAVWCQRLPTPERFDLAQLLGLRLVEPQGSRQTDERNQMKFAMAIVVEADTVADVAAKETELWEDISAVLGDGNGFLDSGHSCVFAGDLFPIADQDEYDSGEAAHAILAGVASLRSVPVGAVGGPRSEAVAVDESAGYLIEWDGGWSTRDTLTEAQEHVKELCGGDPEMTPDEFRITVNCPVEPEGGAMSTSDGLGAPPRDEANQAALDTAVSGNGEDVVPAGCTGAVAYGPTGVPTISHGMKACPVHEDVDAPLRDWIEEYGADLPRAAILALHDVRAKQGHC